MFIAMNRFKVNSGSEADFEAVWKNRDSQLAELPGFETFHLLRGATNEEEGYTLYSSHTVWRNRDDFIFWTKSEQFRNAHRNAGTNKPLYAGPPQFEGFEAIEASEYLVPERFPQSAANIATSENRAKFVLFQAV